MKIALVGSGNVALALAKSWKALGHSVVFGVRDPASAKTKAALAVLPDVKAEGIRDACADAELILVAARPEGTAEIAEAVGTLKGRILVDAMNAMAPIDWPTTTHGFAEILGKAGVVKAFNTLGAEVLGTPKRGSETSDLLVSGDDETAKKVVESLALSMGYGRVIDLGGSETFEMQQNAAKLWIHLAIRRGLGRDLRVRFHP